MDRLTDLCKILYKILDINEKEVPMVIVNNETKQGGYYKKPGTTKNYILIKQTESLTIKEILDVSNSCYLAYYDKNYGMPPKIDKSDYNTLRIFKNKFYRESVYFSHLIVSTILNVMLKYSNVEDYQLALDHFSNPIEANKFDVGDEDINEIQMLLNESFMEINNQWSSKIDEFKNIFEQWFLIY